MTVASDFQMRIAPFKQRAAALRELSKIYRRYPTRVSQQREAVVRGVAKTQSSPLAFFVGGSLAYGQAVEESDADITLMAWEGKEPGDEQLLDATYSQSWLFNALSGIEISGVEIEEVRAFLDPSRHPNGSTKGWSAIKVLYYYYWTCPLRVGFDCAPLIEQLESMEEGQRAILNYLPIVLVSLDGRRDFWQKSFGKYKMRLSQHPVFQAQTASERQAVFDAIAMHEQMFFGSSP